LISTSLRTDIRSVSDTASYPIIMDLDTGKRIIQSLTFLPLGTVINRVPL